MIFQTEEGRDDDGPPGKWGQPRAKGLLLRLSASALASVPICIPASRTVPLTECYCTSGPFLACTGEADPEGGVTCHGHLVGGGPRSPVLHPSGSPPFHDSLHQGAFEPLIHSAPRCGILTTCLSSAHSSTRCLGLPPVPTPPTPCLWARWPPTEFWLRCPKCVTGAVLTTHFLTLLFPAGVRWTLPCSQAVHTGLDRQLHHTLGAGGGTQTGRRAVETVWVQHL